MNKGLLSLLTITLSTSVVAQNTVDVYGLDSKASAAIEKKYHASLDKLAQALLKDDGTLSAADSAKLKQEKQALLQKIKTNEHLAYADLAIHFSKNHKDQYTVLELISTDQVQRMRFVRQTPKIKVETHPDDLVQKMVHYEAIEQQLLATQALPNQQAPCPVYHCSWGFSHPKLMPLFTTFVQEVPKNKALVLKALAKDPDPSRRAAAAALSGYFTNPKEIVRVLNPYVLDADSAVRAHAAEVVLSTKMKSMRTPVDIKPYIGLIESPSVQDRNRALAILSLAAQKKAPAARIKKQVARRLVDLLGLKEADNHAWAYQLLKQISHKNYSEHDISAWEKWAIAVAK